MKLTRVRIKDFRSFSSEHEFDVSSGVNYFVGPNNCGKSNLVRAVELALDPDSAYDPVADRPARPVGVGQPPFTRITLVFKAGSSSTDRTLVKRAREYEIALRVAQKRSTGKDVETFADAAEVHFVTVFGVGGKRQIQFQAKALGSLSLPVESTAHIKLEAQFRRVVRFGVVHSGEDLESLLNGKFRQILQLVIADHLKTEFEGAEKARSDYQTALQTQLLEPLRSRVLAEVGGVFPEITTAELVPTIPSVADTLSNVDVRLGDAAATALAAKGTGVRGAVLISMLRYLAEQSRRTLVLAVEEPEAFLHPGAQELVRDHLDGLARRGDVTLLVTTHSPYVISRDGTAMITELRKGGDGVTRRVAAAAGDESRAELLGSLFRDSGFARVLERSLEIPAGTAAVVVTEGFTDGHFISAVLSQAAKLSLLDGVYFLPAGNATKVVPQAILARAATEAPVLALLDADDPGRAASKKLTSFNDWSTKKGVLTLDKWPGSCGKHDIEVEDLLPAELIVDLVDDIGEELGLDAKEKCGESWHFRLSVEGKKNLIETIDERLVRLHPDSSAIEWLVKEIRGRTGI